MPGRTGRVAMLALMIVWTVIATPLAAQRIKDGRAGLRPHRPRVDSMPSTRPQTTARVNRRCSLVEQVMIPVVGVGALAVGLELPFAMIQLAATNESPARYSLIKAAPYVASAAALLGLKSYHDCRQSRAPRTTR